MMRHLTIRETPLQLCTFRQVAHRQGMTTAELRELIRKGQGPCVTRLGPPPGREFVTLAAYGAWVERRNRQYVAAKLLEEGEQW